MSVTPSIAPASTMYDVVVDHDQNNGMMSETTQQQQRYTEIEISVKCRGLKKMDWRSNTDAFCVVHITEPSSVSNDSTVRERHVSRRPSGRSVELGRTEVVHDTQNPNFSTAFKTNYIFEEQQTLIIRVYHEEKKRGVGVEQDDLCKHAKFVGSATLTLSELMGARGNTIKLNLEKKGHIIVHAEEIAACNDELQLQLAGCQLKNCESSRLFGKSDPFFTISRMHEDGDFVQIFKSEVIRNCLFPEWTPVRLSLQKICNSDLDRPIKIEIFDYEKDGNHDAMGRVDTTVRNLTELESFEVVYDGAPFGSLLVRQAQVIQVPTLLDYLSGGRCDVHFMAAVDFSASNGNPATRDGLHFMDHRGFPNEYQAAIGTIGSILQDYCADNRRCHLLGFGMKDRMKKKPVHVFPIGDPCGVVGVEGMLDAYKNHIGNTDYAMSEPTLMAPLIKEATDFSLQRAEVNEQAYTVLLILSDGGINDMQQTIEEIYIAADAPLSIVIVGVGNGDFSNMEELDADDQKLSVSFSRKECWRDIVQFVPFRKFSSCAPRLASETLAEIPDQLVQYFLSKGIMPSPRVAEPLSESDIEYAHTGSVEVYVNSADADADDTDATSTSAVIDALTLHAQPLRSPAEAELIPVVTSGEPIPVATLVTQQPLSEQGSASADGVAGSFQGELLPRKEGKARVPMHVLESQEKKRTEGKVRVPIHVLESPEKKCY